MHATAKSRSGPGMSWAWAALWACLLAAAIGACDRPAPAPSRAHTPLSVVATTGMIADAARRIAGERAEVTALMGPGVDPHLYAATHTDIERLMRAHLVLYNGLLLEGRMTDTLVRAATSGRRVIAVTERLDPSELLTPDGAEGHEDPHVWMDPRAWSRAVEVVRDALIAADPAHEAEYRANADRYLADIAALDEYAERVLATVPAERRALVTAHDAFNYLGRRYGYEVIGIQGISTESEAGVRDIERLVDLLVRRGIPAVFVETSVSDRQVRALAAGAEARGHRVDIGGSLFSDALGPADAYEGTYLGMIDHNVTTIARALGGDAPERGWRGALSADTRPAEEPAR